MSSKLERAGILIIAIVFVVSTIGIGVFYVMQAQKDNKDTQTQASIQKALQESQKKPQEQTKPLVCANNQSINYKAEVPMKGKPLPNYVPQASVPELTCTDIVIGTGAEVKAGDTVTVNYTGALASNGTVFESSLDSGQTATFGLDQVIPGWTQGLPGMKEGGTRRLFIPAALAYGAQGQGSIPANSALVFDVTLIKIGK